MIRTLFYGFFPSMSDDAFRSLASLDDWAAARDASADQPVVIFKHSSMCPTSARANGEMSTLAADVPVYRIVVQDARDVADAIADDLGIRHETPQAIVLAGGNAAFDTSHYRVTEEKLRDAMDDVTAPTDE